MIEKIVLDVGGVRMTTTKSVLLRSPFFRGKLDEWNNVDEIFIDQDPKIFSHVLNYLRDPIYVVPKKYRENFDRLLQYYSTPTSHSNELNENNTNVRVTDDGTIESSTYVQHTRENDLSIWDLIRNFSL
jgi:hypothetical protein